MISTVFTDRFLRHYKKKGKVTCAAFPEWSPLRQPSQQEIDRGQMSTLRSCLVDATGTDGILMSLLWTLSVLISYSYLRLSRCLLFQENWIYSCATLMKSERPHAISQTACLTRAYFKLCACVCVCANIHLEIHPFNYVHDGWMEPNRVEI